MIDECHRGGANDESNWRDILELIPSSLFRLPTFLTTWLFGTKSKKLLQQILKDADLTIYKWSVNSLVSWENEIRLNNCFKLEGENDKLIPPTGDKRSVVVENGQHFMVFDKAEEVTVLLNDVILKFKEST